MNKFLCLVLCFLHSLSSCSAGTTTFNHRETTLEDFKSIDGLVSSGLPLFNHGFFVNTENGPILVKAKEETGSKKPRLNPGYYSSLPRVIPSGYEGLAVSHFNLGTSIPAQTPVGLGSPDVIQRREYIEPTPEVQDSQVQYTNAGTNSVPPAEVYEQQQSLQQQQYVQQEVQQEVQTQQDTPLSPQQRQQRFLARLRSQSRPRQQQQVAAASVPQPQEAFTLDNLLTPEDRPTSYQNTVFGHSESHKFIRNPTVVQATAFDETLPEDLKNPFYRNQQLASALAQESLPVPGEEVVGEWDTTKIQKQKIQELLRGAGFI